MKPWYELKDGEYLVFDIEADGFYTEATKIHCLAGKVGDEDVFLKVKRQHIQHLKHIFENPAQTVVCHNLIDYDIPMLEKHFGWSVKARLIDTYILSQMLEPDRTGGHSLEQYGIEQGIPKIQNEDWSVYTDHMGERCKTDVEINLAAFKEMQKKGRVLVDHVMAFDMHHPVEMEHSIRKIISDQAKVGCKVDTDKLYKLYEHLDELSVEINEEVAQILGYRIKEGTFYKAPFTKKGGYNTHVAAWMQGSTILVEGPFCGVEFEQIKTTMHAEVKKVMLQLGWEPIAFTDKGSPKYPEEEGDWEALALLTDSPELKVLATSGTINDRRNKVLGWINHLREDNTLPAPANSVGTNTARMRHAILVNVARVTIDKNHNPVYYPEYQPSKFGTEMREVFIAGHENHKMVGFDAKGLEMRCLAHYLENDEFVDIVLNGDVHKYFWDKSLGLIETRDDTKTNEYAWLYGAGDPKLGTGCTGVSVNERTGATGLKLRQTWETEIEGLGDLIQGVQKASLRGFLRGIDNRPIFMRSSGARWPASIGGKKFSNPKGIKVHTALNTLLQSAGSILMKYLTVELWKRAKEEELRAWEVINMHDEVQAVVHEDDINRYTELVHDCSQWVTEKFNMYLPIEQDVKVGNNWMETH